MKIERKKIHFVGIGGAGMCGIAEILSTMGHIVSGSDIASSPIVERLKSLNIEVTIGHNKKNVADKDIIVFSTAIKKTNPELIYARELKIPILGRGEMLAELMAFKKGIAIAGTHGKTTTTSMLASVLQEAELDPTILIGGTYSKINSNAKLGAGDFLIAEVDESDRSFLKTLPTVATILNIDPDHINMFNESSTSYKNFDEMILAYSTFVRKIPQLGKIIINFDDPILSRISKEHIRDYIYFSLNDKDATFYADNIKYKDVSSFFDLYHNGELVDTFEIKMLGRHNIMNALATISTAFSLGVPLKVIKKGLQLYDGIDRRLEFLKNEKDYKVLIDYGHHPVEIKHTLKTLKDAFKEFKLKVIFQPHRYSRTEYLFDEFKESFGDADVTYITDIYKASESEIPGITGERLANETPGAKYLKDPVSLFPELKKDIKKTIVLFLGAGDVNKLGQKLAEEL